MKLHLITLLVVGTTLAAAGPSSVRPTDNCHLECPTHTSNKFRYQLRKTYVYSYEALTTTAVVGMSDSKAETKLTAQVEVEVHDKCEYQLRLKQASLQAPRLDSRSIQDYERKLTANPMKFSWNDGLIMKACPSSDDPNWAVNIKKAILSSIQNKMTSFDSDFSDREVDIIGNCVTDYKASSNMWGNKEVTKEKKLESCTRRFGNRSMIQSDHYFLPFAGFQKIPLLDTVSKCKQTINKEAIMSSVVCEEELRFRPFSNGINAPTTKVSTKLTYQSTKNSVSAPMRLSARRCLLFQHSDVETQAATLSDAERKLSEICSNTQQEIKANVPELFNELVSIIEKLSQNDVKSLHNKVENNQICPIAKHYLIDALPVAGNAGSVAIIAKLIKEKKVSKAQESALLTGLAFNPRPTEEGVQAALPLLEVSSGDLNMDAVLSVSSMIHTYCRLNEDCEQKPSMTRVFTALQKLLGYKCRTSTPQEKFAVMAALKAFGNIGRLGSAESTVKNCYEDQSTDISVKVAAVQAYRRVPCSREETERKVSLFEKTEKDVELRLTSYLQAMRCIGEFKSIDLMKKITKQLESEPINQVSSFVWSHLTNLQETSSPLKSHIRKFLQRFTIKECKNTDFRKYSRNYEISKMNERFNIGADFDSNVIFTPKSYLPRSIVSNFSANAFGYSVNMLEIGARMQGMDTYAEKYISLENVQENFENVIRTVAQALKLKIQNIEDSVHRSKRSTYSAAHMQHIERQNNEISQEEPDASFYIKVFGNELKYITMQDLVNLKQNQPNVADMLKKMAEGLDANVAKSIVLANNRLSVPTISGFPLRLAINATASVGIKVNGKFDVRDLLLKPRNVNIDGHLKPSGSMLVSSAMYIDTGVSKHGLKMKASYHSSSVISGKILVKDGEFEIKLDTPRSEANIMDMKSEMLLMNPGQLQPLRILGPSSKKFDKCLESLYKPFGMHVCIKAETSAMHGDRPSFPFNGPRSFRLYLKKADQTMRGYLLKGKIVRPRYFGADASANLEFKTPGSQVDRHLSIEGKFRQANNQFTLNTKSPYGSVDIDGSLRMKQTIPEKVNLNVKVTGSKQYSVKSELRLSGTTSDSFEYVPQITVKYPESSPFTVNGKINFQYKRQTFHKIELSLRSNQPSSDPYSFTSVIRKDGDMSQSFEIVSNVSMSSPELKMNFDGSVSRARNVNYAALNYWYEPKDKPRHTISWHAKIKNLSTETLHKYNTITGMTSSLYPAYNWQTVWNVQMADKYFENEMEIGYGVNMNWDHQKIKFLDIYQYQMDESTKMLSYLDLKSEIKQASKNIDIAYHGTFRNRMQQNLPHITVNNTLKISTEKIYKSSADINVQSVKPIKANAEILVNLPERDIILRENFEQSASLDAFNGKLFLQWAEDMHIQHTYNFKVTEIGEVNGDGKIEGTVSDRVLPIDYDFSKKISNDKNDYTISAKVKSVPSYRFTLQHSRNAPIGKATWRTPKSNGVVSLDATEPSFAAAVNVQGKTQRLRTIVKFQNKENTVRAELSWDLRGVNATQFSVVGGWGVTERKQHIVTGKVKLQGQEVINVDVKLYEPLVRGPHSAKVKVHLPDSKPVSAGITYGMSTENMHVSVSYDHDNQQIIYSKLKLKMVPDTYFPYKETNLNLVLKSAVIEALKDFEFDQKIKYAKKSQNSMSSDNRLYIKIKPSKELRVNTLTDVTIRDESVSINGNSVFTSDFEGAKNIKTTFKGTVYTKSMNFNGEAETTLDDGSKIKNNLNYEKSNDKFEVQWKQTGSSNREIKFLATQSPDYKRWEYDVLYNNNGDEYKFDVSRNYQNSFVYVTKVNVNSPFEALKKASLSVERKAWSMLDTKIDAKLNENENVIVESSTSRRGDHFTWKLLLKSPLHEPLDVNLSLLNPSDEIYTFTVSKGQKQWLHSAVTYTDNDAMFDTSFLLKYDQTELVNMKVGGNMVGATVKLVATANGIFTPLKVVGSVGLQASGYLGSMKMCSGSKCIKMNARVSVSMMDQQQYDINVDSTFTTSRNHVIGIQFALLNKTGRQMNEVKFFFDKANNRFLGYNFLLEKPNGKMRLEVSTADRKAVVDYQSLQRSSTDSITIKVSGNEDDHALNINLKKVKVNDKNYVYQAEIRHPSLSKPITIKHTIKELGYMIESSTEFEFSADKSKDIMTKIVLDRSNGNSTAKFRMYAPNSNKFDINAMAHIGFTQSMITLGAKADWQTETPSEKPKEVFVFYKFVPRDGRFEFFYRHPGRVIDVHGRNEIARLGNNRNGILVTAEAINNGEKQKMVAKMDMSTPVLMTMLVTDERNPSDGYELSLKETENEDEIVLAYENIKNGQKTKFVQASLRFNSTHVLHTSLQWNPIFIRNLYVKTKEQVIASWKSISENTALHDEVVYELNKKFSRLLNAIEDEVINPLVEHVVEEAKRAGQELVAEWERVKVVVEQHRQQMKSFFEKEMEIIKTKAERAFAPLVQGWEEVKQNVNSQFTKICEKLKQDYPEKYAEVEEYAKKVRKSVQEKYTSLKTTYEQTGINGIISNAVGNSTIAQVFDSMASYELSLYTSQMMDDISNSYNNTISKMKAKYEEIMEKVQEMAIYKTYVSFKSYIFDKYGEYKYNWNQYVEELEKELAKYPELKNIIEGLRLMRDRALYSVSNMAFSKYIDYATIIRTLVPYEPIVNFDMGVMSFDVAVPYTADSVQQWSESSRLPEVSPVDIYYNMKQYSSPRKWLPPFDANAMLIGSKHYMTFDKQHFDFVGGCSYVLAKDFKDNTFTVIAHYKRDRKISLTVLVGDKQIDISNDFKTSLDRKETDLPIHVDDVIVSRLSNTITITKPNKLNIKCDWKHDICSIEMDGRYFGKTSGMLGKYDNEPHTDMRKPSGEPAKEVYRLADSWGVSSKCSTLQNYARNDQVKSGKTFDRCVAMFQEKDSPFRPCFLTVKPEKFFEMCLSSDESSNDNFCRVSAAYASACNEKNIQISIPEECITCDLRRQRSRILQRGDSVQIKPDTRRKATDIVYIIENKRCNSPIIRKLLSKPPMILSRELRSQRIYSRVSVVSYGGKSKPQLHTAKGRNFYSFRDMVLAMKTLYTTPRVSDSEQSDTFEAIRFASELSFNPASAKIFILVKCTKCVDGESMKYADVQQLLLSQGIILNVLAPEPISLKSKNQAKSKKIFGISSKTVYSQKDVSQKQLVGSPDLMSVITVPRDICVSLAQEIGGAYFTQLPLIEYRSLEKNFELVMSRQITSTANPGDCQNCKCVSTLDYVGKTMCGPCRIPSPLVSSQKYQAEDEVNRIASSSYGKGN